MVDLHHHCLPGVDDGPSTLEEAVAQCEAAFADGIRTVVATPHQRHPQYDVPAGRAREAHAALVAALRERRVGLEVLLGAEVHFHEGIAEGLRGGALLPLGGNRRWFLFELPATHVPGTLEEFVFAVQLAGWYPILAHPERNVELAERAGGLEAIRGRGVPVQVTAMSLTGEFGDRARRAAERWVAGGLVDLLATDAHGTGARPPRLRAAVDRAAALAGRDAAERLVAENPRRVLRGEDVL